MCGIAAEYGHSESDDAQAMLDRIAHRGPDGEGLVRLDHAWLGHRRLSIVDLEGGSQPLERDHPSEEHEMWLVGNGEIYNHEGLRESLEDHIFSSRSDNEVALHLMSERGPDALAELIGMYAFCAAGTEGQFVAARDPVGIKPLYWAKRNGSVRFASEMRAFDAEWLPHVEVFPPGHHWTPEDGLQRFANAVPAGATEAVEGPTDAGAEAPDDVLVKTREVLIQAVDRRLMADVPVGVFLSGGLDSSLIAAIAARRLAERGETLKTFAVGVEGSADIVAARVVAEYLGTEHRECTYTASEAHEILPEVVRSIESFDPSLVRSAVPNYMLARFTAQHVKVVLTGEGADELFAGYEYLREHQGEPQVLQDELVRIVHGLHDLNLQRCDRVTMAHGLEARVPFLDRDVVEHCLSLPTGWKFAGPDQQEKRLLRRAFNDWLPEEILWRGKEQFGDGSGAADVLTAEIEESISDEEFEDERDQLDPPVRSKEELAYFRILREHLPGLQADQTIGRFATV
ncbi:MAG: asparagine synthase B [Solirubrobacterales bacterium]